MKIYHNNIESSRRSELSICGKVEGILARCIGVSPLGLLTERPVRPLTRHVNLLAPLFIKDDLGPVIK